MALTPQQLADKLEICIETGLQMWDGEINQMLARGKKVVMEVYDDDICSESPENLSNACNILSPKYLQKGIILNVYHNVDPSDPNQTFSISLQRVK